MTAWIKIPYAFSSKDELAMALGHIAELISEGYTCGFDPSWELTDDGEEEDGDDDE